VYHPGHFVIENMLPTWLVAWASRAVQYTRGHISRKKDLRVGSRSQKSPRNLPVLEKIRENETSLSSIMQLQVALGTVGSPQPAECKQRHASFATLYPMLVSTKVHCVPIFKYIAFNLALFLIRARNGYLGPEGILKKNVLLHKNK
jgi:hypothetical protein